MSCGVPFKMLNILEFMFLSLAIAITFTGILIQKYEVHLPVFILKSFRYGSFAHQGPGDNFLKKIELPKSYFKHFYVFSTLYCVATLSYMVFVYFFDVGVNRYVQNVVKFILEQDRPSVSVTAALTAVSLLSIQCARRWYETHYLQVFAKASRMNLSHYLAGIIHYFGCIFTVFGQAPLFCGQQSRASIAWSDTYTNIVALPAIVVFLFAFYEQYQSNVIFANLRKDKKSQQVVTEEHKIPRGRLFERVSSPHRLCEVILYTVLVLLVPTRTFFCIYLWVLSNQIHTAIEAHTWYKKAFKDYPTNRYAIFPSFY